MCTSPYPVYMTKATGEKWNTFFFKSRYMDELPELKKHADSVNDPDNGYHAKLTPVGCGYCMECRLHKSRQWANRLVMEGMTYDNMDSCFFVTLTYESPPISETGAYTLDKLDVKRFMNSLRKHYNRQDISCIRFFEVGEYGSLRKRPHYHLILFNIPLDDLTYFFSNKFGDSLYRSSILEHYWGLGHAVVGEFSWTTGAYVARYNVKKLYGKDAYVYKELGLFPEYLNTSRMPGIGRMFYEKHKDTIYELCDYDEENDIYLFRDQIVLPSVDGAKNVVKPPRYFDDLFKMDDPRAYELLSKARQHFGELNSELRHQIFQMSDRDFFETQADILSRSRKGMYRDFIKQIE